MIPYSAVPGSLLDQFKLYMPNSEMVNPRGSEYVGGVRRLQRQSFDDWSAHVNVSCAHAAWRVEKIIITGSHIMADSIFNAQYKL